MDTGWMLDLLVKSTVVLAGAMGVVRCMRRASAAARHAVWTGALAAVLVMPLLAIVVPAWQVLPRWVGAEVKSVEGTSAAPEAQDVAVNGNENAGDLKGFATVATRHVMEDSAPVAMPAEAEHQSGFAWWPVSILVYALGVLLAVLPVVAGGFYLVRIERGAERISHGTWMGLVVKVREMLGIRREVVLLRAARREVMPMTWGLWRPRVLVPASAETWSAERRRMVLLHEGAHVKRGDALTQLIGSLACGVYWFHPLAWYAKHRARVEAEHACDDVVMAACGRGEGMKASAYAAELLAVAGAFRASGMHSGMAIAMARGSGGQLQSRIRAILDTARNRRGVSVRRLTVGAIVTMGIVVSLAAIRAAETAAPTAGQARKEDFSHNIHFGSGLGMFQPDDNITITEVRGPSNYVAAGNTYRIKGTYTLASADEANLAAFVTSGAGDTEHDPIDARQMMRVHKGGGDFTLVMPFHSQGSPHVSFYPADRKEVFGGIYFWGLETPPRELPPGGVARLIARATGLEFEGKATTWEELPALMENVKEPSTKDLMVSLNSDGGIADQQAIISRVTHMKTPGFRSLVFSVQPRGKAEKLFPVESRSSSVTVLVSPTGISFEGKATTWAELPGLLENVPDREKTILAMKLTTDQMRVKVRNDAFDRLSTLAKKYGFRYLSDAGVEAGTEGAGTQEGAMLPARIYVRNGSIAFENGKATIEADEMITTMTIPDMPEGSVFSVHDGKVQIQLGERVMEAESISFIVPVKGSEEGKRVVADLQEGKVRVRAGDGSVLIGDRIAVSADGQITAKGGIFPAMENALGARQVTEPKASDSPSVKTGGK